MTHLGLLDSAPTLRSMTPQTGQSILNWPINMGLMTVPTLYHGPHGSGSATQPPRTLSRQDLPANPRCRYARSGRRTSRRQTRCFAFIAPTSAGRRRRRSVSCLMHTMRRVHHGVPTTSHSLGTTRSWREASWHAIHRSHTSAVCDVYRYTMHHDHTGHTLTLTQTTTNTSLHLIDTPECSPSHLRSVSCRLVV